MANTRKLLNMANLWAEGMPDISTRELFTAWAETPEGMQAILARTREPSASLLRADIQSIPKLSESKDLPKTLADAYFGPAGKAKRGVKGKDPVAKTDTPSNLDNAGAKPVDTDQGLLAGTPEEGAALPPAKVIAGEGDALADPQMTGLASGDPNAPMGDIGITSASTPSASTPFNVDQATQALEGMANGIAPGVAVDPVPAADPNMIELFNQYQAQQALPQVAVDPAAAIEPSMIQRLDEYNQRLQSEPQLTSEQAAVDKLMADHQAIGRTPKRQDMVRRAQAEAQALEQAQKERVYGFGGERNPASRTEGTRQAMNDFASQTVTKGLLDSPKDGVDTSVGTPPMTYSNRIGSLVKSGFGAARDNWIPLSVAAGGLATANAVLRSGGGGAEPQESLDARRKAVEQQIMLQIQRKNEQQGMPQQMPQGMPQ